MQRGDNMAKNKPVFQSNNPKSGSGKTQKANTGTPAVSKKPTRGNSRGQ